MVFLVKISPELKIDWQSDYQVMRFREFAKDNVGKVLRIELPEPKRSLSQNALYWVYLTKIALETGDDTDDLHEVFKKMFLPRRIVRVGKSKKDVSILGSTTKLKKHEFGEYMDKIERRTEILIPTKEEAEAMGYISNN